jgi:hypothetical protein
MSETKYHIPFFTPAPPPELHELDSWCLEYSLEEDQYILCFSLYIGNKICEEKFILSSEYVNSKTFESALMLQFKNYICMSLNNVALRALLLLAECQPVSSSSKNERRVAERIKRIAKSVLEQYK